MQAALFHVFSTVLKTLFRYTATRHTTDRLETCPPAILLFPGVLRREHLFHFKAHGADLGIVATAVVCSVPVPRRIERASKAKACEVSTRIAHTEHPHLRGIRLFDGIRERCLLRVSE